MQGDHRGKRTGAGEYSLGKGLVVAPEELKERVRVGLNVELHLSFLHDLM